MKYRLTENYDGLFKIESKDNWFSCWRQRGLQTSNLEDAKEFLKDLVVYDKQRVNKKRLIEIYSIKDFD